MYCKQQEQQQKNISKQNIKNSKSQKTMNFFTSQFVCIENFVTDSNAYDTLTINQSLTSSIMDRQSNNLFLQNVSKINITSNNISNTTLQYLRKIIDPSKIKECYILTESTKTCRFFNIFFEMFKNISIVEYNNVNKKHVISNSPSTAFEEFLNLDTLTHLKIFHANQIMSCYQYNLDLSKIIHKNRDIMQYIHIEDQVPIQKVLIASLSKTTNLRELYIEMHYSSVDTIEIMSLIIQLLMNNMNTIRKITMKFTYALKPFVVQNNQDQQKINHLSNLFIDYISRCKTLEYIDFEPFNGLFQEYKNAIFIYICNHMYQKQFTHQFFHWGIIYNEYNIKKNIERDGNNSYILSSQSKLYFKHYLKNASVENGAMFIFENLTSCVENKESMRLFIETLSFRFIIKYINNLYEIVPEKYQNDFIECIIGRLDMWYNKIQKSMGKKINDNTMTDFYMFSLYVRSKIDALGEQIFEKKTSSTIHQFISINYPNAYVILCPELFIEKKTNIFEGHDNLFCDVFYEIESMIGTCLTTDLNTRKCMKMINKRTFQQIK